MRPTSSRVSAGSFFFAMDESGSTARSVKRPLLCSAHAEMRLSSVIDATVVLATSDSKSTRADFGAFGLT